MHEHIAQAYLNVSLRIPIEDPKVKQRLDRGYNIVSEYGYEIVPCGAGAYLVQKASTSMLVDMSAEYRVTSEHCTCPDFATARAGLCKHRLAVMIVEDMLHAASPVRCTLRDRAAGVRAGSSQEGV